MPLTKTLHLALSPIEAAARLRHLPGFIYFDSAAPSAGGAVSLLSANPLEIHVGHLQQDIHHLRDCLARHQEVVADCGFPLGGLFGYVGYDGHYVFGEYDSLLVYHHEDDCWEIAGTPNFLAELDSPLPEPFSTPSHLSFQAQTSRENYLFQVRQAQEWIAAGDIYQVNLTQQFCAERQPEHDPFPIYERLRTISPAAYSAFLNLNGRQILSSSPECFLRMSGRGITTRPIKGTRPRFGDPLLDEQSAYDLITSPKEIAELVMITDLERNDLGRICTFGSVRVDELLKLERYAQVFHLVSTVSGELREEVDHVEALRLCSPGGSITGAPKKRAMEIIQALEPVPRGIYTGAIGYLGWNGESQFNIAIRTLIGESDHWHFHVGAGIVSDSDPMAEYEETLHKAAGIFRACDLH